MAARRKNAAQANGPHSAPHTPPPPPPAPSAGPPAGGPAAAVWAALTASPGAAAAPIAAAAGTSRIARRPGTGRPRSRRPGHPDPRSPQGPRHRPGHLAAPPPPPAPADPAGAEEAPPASPAADTATASPAPAAVDGDLPAPDSAPDEPAGGQPDAGTAGSAPAGDGSAGQTAPAPADSGTPGEAADPGAPDASPPADSVPADSAGETAAPAPAGGEPQPAAAGEAAALLRELASAATGAGDALDRGDSAAALAVMDGICAGAAQSRRLVKAAAAGRKPRGTAGTPGRPGQLRDLVGAHLLAHPGTDFTPHQIGRVLDRSSGAVANALDRLTALGRAHLTSEKPRRYQATEPAPDPAETTADDSPVRQPGSQARGHGQARAGRDGAYSPGPAVGDLDLVFPRAGCCPDAIEDLGAVGRPGAEGHDPVVEGQPPRRPASGRHDEDVGASVLGKADPVCAPDR
jgi:hypothetical protein